VIGVQDAPRHEVVFVQVTNPAPRAMRLTKLEYTFATSSATISEGSVDLSRDIPANAAIVVEVPLDTPSEVPMTLTGKLTAELDQIVRTFKVSAAVAPSK
jgi:LEA14-like dessication related protein